MALKTKKHSTQWELSEHTDMLTHHNRYSSCEIYSELFLTKSRSPHCISEREKHSRNLRQTQNASVSYRSVVGVELICKPCNFRKINRDDDKRAPLGLKMLNQPSSPCQLSLKGKPSETNNVKLLPSDSHQDILSDYWCQHPINYSLWTFGGKWSFKFCTLLSQSFKTNLRYIFFPSMSLLNHWQDI